MRRSTFQFFIVIFTLVLSLSFVSCAKKAKQDGDSSSAVSESDISSDLADSDSGKAMGLETVQFAYDSAILDSSGKATLRSNAKILKDKPSLKVQIEGHTDERGGIQYNIALGERRANSVRAYLVDQGISEDRMTIISYGKEKPVDSAHDEKAWAKNRRGNFRVTER